MIKRFFIYWLPVIVWAFVIFTFSSFPTNPVAEIHWKDFIIKKSAHVFVYGVLAMFLYRAFINHKVEAKKAALMAVLLSVIYGITDEYHQSFTPGRDPQLRDVGFDTLGAMLSMYAINSYLPGSSEKLVKLAKKIDLIK